MKATRIFRSVPFVCAVAVACLSLLLLSDPSGAQARVTRVLGAKGTQTWAESRGGYLFWATLQRKSKTPVNAFARTPSGKTIKLNVNGASGQLADLGTTSIHTIAYQQFTRYKSKIRFIDLTTEKRWDAPAAVNAGSWQYFAGYDGTHLTFARTTRRWSKMIAYNMKTKKSSVLGRTKVRRHWIMEPGSIAGNRLTWQAYNMRTHKQGPVWLADLTRPRSAHIVLRPRRSEVIEASVLTQDGTMYAIVERPGCGKDVRIVRFQPTSSTTYRRHVVLRFPAGTDTMGLTVSLKGSPNQLMFSRYSCRRGIQSSDIYKVADAAPAVTPSSTSSPAPKPVQQYSLQIRRSGSGGGTVTGDGGINCGSQCNTSFPAGTVVTLKANPDTTSHFTGWTGACTGSSASCQFKIQKDTLTTANFDVGP